MARVVLSCLVLAVALCGASAEEGKIFPALRKKKQQAQATHEAHKSQKAKEAEAEIVDAPLPGQKAEDIVVPDLTNVGPDGFPMLSGVSQTLKSINTEASSLEAKLVQAQIANQAAMARKKASFEQKLRVQEEGNRMVIAENGKIAEDNKVLEDTNSEIRKHAKELEGGNRLMRAELKVIQQKLGVARDFVMGSMKSTDDSKAKELAVLGIGSQHHKIHHVEISEIEDEDDEDDSDKDDEKDKDDDEDDKSDEKDDDKDEADSFLAVSSSRTLSPASSKPVKAAKATLKPVQAVAKDSDDDSEDGSGADDEAEPSDASADEDMLAAEPTQAPASPSGLLDMLGKGVAALANQEKQSEAKLKAMFNAEFKAGVKRHTALLKKQQALNTTRTQLTHLQGELRKAESHLEDTRDHLEQRLRGVGLFLQRTAHLALAPASEAPHLLDSLPGTVSIPALPAKKVAKAPEDANNEAELPSLDSQLESGQA